MDSNWVDLECVRRALGQFERSLILSPNFVCSAFGPGQQGQLLNRRLVLYRSFLFVVLLPNSKSDCHCFVFPTAALFRMGWSKNAPTKINGK